MPEINNKTQKPHHGVIVPMVTPITEKYELDEPALRKIIDHLIEGGAHGIFALGSIGEGPSLPRVMRSRIVHQTLGHVKGRARVYAGILDNSAVDVVTTAREYLKMGVGAVVVQLPNYFNLGSDEQFHYFTGLVERIKGSILLYEIPDTVHMSIDLSVIEHLRAFSHVVGIKDSSDDANRVEALLEAYSDDPAFSVLVGSAGLYSYGLRHGADGIVPGIGNLEPGLCARLYASSLTGDWTLMGDLQAEMDRQTREFLVPEYLGQTVARLKWLMSQRGLCGPTVFPPLKTLVSEKR